MGLDMYLCAKSYVSPYSDKKLHEQLNGVLEPFFPLLKGKANGVTFEAAYWRKANAIHNWFVKNVQSGRDECQESPVSTEQLQALVTACKKVLEDPSCGPEVLPTVGGFFFGETQYDEYYFADLQHTVEQLEPLLTEDSTFEFTYRASW